MQNSRLFLIPVGLSPANYIEWMGAQVREAVRPLRKFVVEHPKSARQFLKALELPVQELEFEVLDEHATARDVDRIALWFQSGQDIGLLSEAGCPAIADPGALLVSRAHRLGIQVIPLIGPSSIVLALMASGLNGQRFAFNGYLPQSADERDARIRALEERSRRFDQTEIFIETPYRNEHLYKALTTTCATDTLLSLASDLTGSTEEIRTRSIADWRRNPMPLLHKRPTIFLLLANKARSANGRTRSAQAN